MWYYACFACGNPHFHTSWYKISYDTRAKNVFLTSVITSHGFGSCCKLTLVRKFYCTRIVIYYSFYIKRIGWFLSIHMFFRIFLQFWNSCFRFFFQAYNYVIGGSVARTFLESNVKSCYENISKIRDFRYNLKKTKWKKILKKSTNSFQTNKKSDTLLKFWLIFQFVNNFSVLLLLWKINGHHIFKDFCHIYKVLKF